MLCSGPSLPSSLARKPSCSSSSARSSFNTLSPQLSRSRHPSESPYAFSGNTVAWPRCLCCASQWQEAHRRSCRSSTGYSFVSCEERSPSCRHTYLFLLRPAVSHCFWRCSLVVSTSDCSSGFFLLLSRCSCLVPLLHLLTACLQPPLNRAKWLPLPSLCCASPPSLVSPSRTTTRSQVVALWASCRILLGKRSWPTYASPARFLQLLAV
jgi:hypothetical protein